MEIGGRVAVLLATYNGEAFVREQIESIRAQTWRDWSLLIRDDGSSDGTQGVLAAMAAQDDRIRLLPKTSADQGRGVIGNFSRLMQVAAADDVAYAMFADQDDVWLPNKIELLMDEMRRAESEVGADTPLLVHSDLEVVDDRLERLSPSFLRFQGIRHENDAPLRVLLPQNFVTGCATLFNRALLDLALPVPSDVVMHDWWLALLAAAAGEIRFVGVPTVRYRQHGNNQVGAKSLWVSLLSPGSIEQRVRRGHLHFIASVNQAARLAERLRERNIPMPAEARDVIQFYAGMRSMGRYERLVGAREFELGPQHPVRRAVFFARLLRTARRRVQDRAERA